MEKDNFAFASMRIRIFEKNLVNQLVFSRMVEAKDLSAALEILKETRYVDKVNALKSKAEFESMLSEELKNQANKVLELVNDETLRKLLFLKYDYHNLKLLIRSERDNKNLEYLFFGFGNLYIPEVRSWIKDSKQNPKNTVMECAFDEALKSYDEFHDTKKINFILDQAYYTELLEYSRVCMGNEFAKYVVNIIDFTNVLTMLRVRGHNINAADLEEAFIAGGNLDKETLMLFTTLSEDALFKKLVESGISDELRTSYDEYLETDSLSRLEKSRDEYLYGGAIKISDVLYGAEVIYGYVLKIEEEVQNLRIILSGKRAGVDSEGIRERMRICIK